MLEEIECKNYEKVREDLKQGFLYALRNNSEDRLKCILCDEGKPPIGACLDYKVEEEE